MLAAERLRQCDQHFDANEKFPAIDIDDGGRMRKIDPVKELIELLHGKLQLVHIEQMSDTVLKAVAELLLSWEQLVANEVDNRALRARKSRKPR